MSCRSCRALRPGGVQADGRLCMQHTGAGVPASRKFCYGKSVKRKPGSSGARVRSRALGIRPVGQASRGPHTTPWSAATRDARALRRGAYLGSFDSVDSEEIDPEPTTSTPRQSSTAMLLLNLSAILFGSNQVVIKVTEGGLSPSALTALRFAIAAACFAPSIAKGLHNAKLRRAALELGAWLLGGYTMQAIGLEYTSAAHGAFTGTFTVLAVPMLVGLSGRQVAGTTWGAAVAAVAGVALLTTSGAGDLAGDALCIASALAFGVHKWRTEAVTAEFSADTLQLIALQLGALALGAAALAAPDIAAAMQHHTPGELAAMAAGLPWPALAFMGLGTTAATLWIEMNALKHVSAPLAALIYTAEPLWGAAFAWALLGERWGPRGWAGAALIVAATLYAQLSGQGNADKLEVAPPTAPARPVTMRVRVRRAQH